MNTFNDRRQNLVFANYYRQDFIFPGYTAQVSLHYDNDPPSLQVRQEPVPGPSRPGRRRSSRTTSTSVYLGWAGDGHIGRFNLTHQFYWALGRDSLNPLANQAADDQRADGRDRGVVRPRLGPVPRSRSSRPPATSNINNTHATGFDTILDSPNFAGGPFSFWNRQQIPLFGVNLVQRLSLVPDLRSSKIQGQANFVNPGLLLPNLGMDFDLTPKLKLITNSNLLWFDKTNVLEQFLFHGQHRPVHRHRPEHRASSTGRC